MDISGVYKLAGVEFHVNAAGCLMGCNDWETLYEAQPGVRGKEHYGTMARYFQPGFGDRYFATQAFRDVAAMYRRADFRGSSRHGPE